MERKKKKVIAHAFKAPQLRSIPPFFSSHNSNQSINQTYIQRINTISAIPILKKAFCTSAITKNLKMPTMYNVGPAYQLQPNYPC